LAEEWNALLWKEKDALASVEAVVAEALANSKIDSV